jgi:hypothetical protein
LRTAEAFRKRVGDTFLAEGFEAMPRSGLRN